MATSITTVTEDEGAAEEPAPEPPRPAPRKRYAVAWTIGTAIALVAFFWMVTAGTGDLFATDRVGGFHDLQVRAWLDGHWDVAPEAVTIEGFVTEGKTYVYFGPMPALMRLPVLLVTHSLDGRLTRASLTLAFLVTLASCGVLGWRTRRLLRGGDDLSRFETVAVGGMALLIGTGSIVPFYASRSWVYHETTLWAVAFTLAAFAVLLGHLIERRWRTLAGAGALALAAMLTRGSVGIAPAVAIGLVAAVEGVRLLRRRPDASFPRLAALGVAALLPFVAFAGVNLIKFHSALSLPLDRQNITSADTPSGAARRAALADNGGTLFGLKFLPTTVLHYSRPDAIRPQRTFPWLRFPAGARPIGHVTFDTIDPASSVTSSEPALALLAVAGLVAMARRRELRPLLPLLGGAAAGAMTVLAFGFIAHRYLGDLFPLVIVPALAALAVAPTLRWSPAVTRAATVGLTVLAVWSVWASTALTLDYQRFSSPYPYDDGREAMVALQLSIGPRSAFNVIRGDTVPPVGPEGQFLILGQCRALFRSDGHEWARVERSAAAGHLRFRVTFDDKPEGTVLPLFTHPAVPTLVPLALRWLGNGQARFETLDMMGTQSVGRPFSVAASGPRLLDVVIDRDTTEILVRLDGERIVETTFLFLPSEPLSPTKDWAATLEPLPTPTPSCDQLAGDNS